MLVLQYYVRLLLQGERRLDARVVLLSSCLFYLYLLPPSILNPCISSDLLSIPCPCLPTPGLAWNSASAFSAVSLWRHRLLNSPDRQSQLIAWPPSISTV